MVNKSIRPISPIEQTKRSPQRSLNANLMASQNHEENQDIEKKRSLQQHDVEKKRSLQQHGTLKLLSQDFHESLI